MTFEEYESAVTQVPASLRNNLDRINLPVRGLQEEAGKVGILLQTATSSGRLALTAEQQAELRDRLADVLWYAALLAKESGTSIEQIASHITGSSRTLKRARSRTTLIQTKTI